MRSLAPVRLVGFFILLGCGAENSAPDAGAENDGARPIVDGAAPTVDGAAPIVDGAADVADADAASADGGVVTDPTTCSEAAPCFYVTDSGAGARDGSSWSNAFAGLPADGTHRYLDLPYAVLVRGATYFFADGTYSGYVFGDQGGGSERITLRKATVADHGSEDGWDASMGDGEALLRADATVVWFSPGAKHYLFDGQIGSGKTPGGYGFRFFSSAPRDGTTYMINIDSTGVYDEVGDVFDITFQHVEIDWDNGTPAGPCGFSAALQVHGALPNGDWTVAQSYVHHCSGGAAYLRNGEGYAFRDTYFYQMGDETESGACPGADHKHWETFWFTTGSGVELTGNTFENAFRAGQTGWVMLEASDVTISDNLFFCSTPDACAVGGNGVIGAWSSSTNSNVLITRNTFRDFFHGAHYLFERGTNIVIRDNTYDNAPGLADDP